MGSGTMGWIQDNTLNIPPLKVWQLNASSTYADHVGAAPSDKGLLFMWLFWALTAVIAAILAIIVFTGIIRSRRVRSKSFNLYLVFLMIPDIIFSFFCSINCILNMAAGHYISAGWCQFQSIYCVFGIGANAWLNAVIARELYNMLLASRNCERYHPPKVRTVILQSLAVYLWSFTVAMMTLFHLPFYKSGLHIGAACLPLTFDRRSEVFFYCFFLPCFALLPLIYSCWKVVLVIRNKLWPSSERARSLSIYFSRLIIVYIIMWLPSLLLLFVLGGMVNPWLQWTAGAWSHLQGIVSAVYSLRKDDVYKSVKRLFYSSEGDVSSKDDGDMFTTFGSLRRLSSLTAIGSSLRNSLYVAREGSQSSVKHLPQGAPPEDSTKEEEDGGAADDCDSEIGVDAGNGDPCDADNGKKKPTKKSIFHQLDAADVSIHF